MAEAGATLAGAFVRERLFDELVVYLAPTLLGPDARPLAAVVKGAGNRLGDGVDGAVQGSVFATYLHGPCLARNPELADLLLSRVVGALPPLEMPEVDQLRQERLAAPRRV